MVVVVDEDIVLRSGWNTGESIIERLVGHVTSLDVDLLAAWVDILGVASLMEDLALERVLWGLGKVVIAHELDFAGLPAVLDELQVDRVDISLMAVVEERVGSGIQDGVLAAVCRRKKRQHKHDVKCSNRRQKH